MNCYATHKNDVGKIATPFRIRLKPNAQIITQRPSKVPIHYRDKLNTLLKELEKHNIIKHFVLLLRINQFIVLPIYIRALLYPKVIPSNVY